MGQLKVRERALVPMTRPQLAMASSRVGTIRARARISRWPPARATASLIRLGQGIDQHQLSQPMVFMARAADPMLPV